MRAAGANGAATPRGRSRNLRRLALLSLLSGTARAIRRKAAGHAESRATAQPAGRSDARLPALAARARIGCASAAGPRNRSSRGGSGVRKRSLHPGTADRWCVRRRWSADLTRVAGSRAAGGVRVALHALAASGQDDRSQQCEEPGSCCAGHRVGMAIGRLVIKIDQADTDTSAFSRGACASSSSFCLRSCSCSPRLARSRPHRRTFGNNASCSSFT